MYPSGILQPSGRASPRRGVGKGAGRGAGGSSPKYKCSLTPSTHSSERGRGTGHAPSQARYRITANTQPQRRWSKIFQIILTGMAVTLLISGLVYLLVKTTKLDRAFTQFQANSSQLGKFYADLKDTIAASVHSHSLSNLAAMPIHTILNALVDYGYTQCPGGWVLSQRICYLFSNQLDSWQGANRTCVSYNGTLVIVNNHTQQEFLMKHYRLSRWIGLSKLTNNINEFQWVNGAPLVTSYWSLGEPDNSMGRRCVRMTVGGRWRSEQCARRYAYICQVNSIDYVVQQLHLPFSVV
ncbi:CD209 antigen-like protein E [Hemiscyllium ocellatum]|uniref:CD209 antigen-like protein E n=1 Tax=Hemiscyllium ocellatum TaxID=170820 RepID=UPI002967351B|nr:CD209 antigen-like protein E [Hemiscyllium ocellatum]